LHILELKKSNEALALVEARAVAEVVESSPGVALVRGPEVTKDLAMSHAVSEHLVDADAGEVVEALESTGYTPSGTFAVRARVHAGDVSSTELERSVGDVLVRRGAEVDLDSPDEVVRVVVSEGHAYVGVLVCETDSLNRRKPTKKPFFKPGSMSPSLGRALSNIAGGYGDATLLDPTCGTGGVLVESALVDGRPVGVDASREMVGGARTNLGEYAADGVGSLVVGDARSLPISDGSVDCAVTDLPYGRASHVEGESALKLARGVLAELRRVVRDDGGGRVVAVSDEWLDDEARDAGFEVIERIEDRVHRSLTRRIVVLE